MDLPLLGATILRITATKHIVVQVALDTSTFSEDGSLWAYTLGSGGSDWRTLKISRVVQGGREDLAETLQHVKFSSLAWTHDNKVWFGKHDAYSCPATTHLSHHRYHHCRACFTTGFQLPRLLTWARRPTST
jgi:prolyl oligopeptidase PreP (S9A serine peptidase family)